MKYQYYYNNVPGIGLCRNNLIYTSLMSEDKKVFVKWYHNDTTYHKGHNQVVDANLMEEKWNREIKFITLISKHYPDLVPEILDVNESEKKIFLKVDGPDLWEQAGCSSEFDLVLPTWKEQMLDIIKAHKNLGIYKYSMHPSSYFIVDGKLKSINYFFCYFDSEDPIKLSDVMSHISENRQKDLFPKMAAMGIDINKPASFKDIQMLAFESFKTNFPDDVMEAAKKIYV
jgi:hypothetical protein